MCTRFYIEISDEELREITDAASRSLLADRFLTQQAKRIKTSGEVRPTDVAAVIAPNKYGTRTVYPMRWGFNVKGLRTPVFNARTESAAFKPAFREAWKSHRCIVPASWYFEWEHIKQPDGKIKTGTKYAIQPTNFCSVWLCGLYRIENQLPVFTILTREASENLQHIHDRMPLILPAERIDQWIHPETKPEDLLRDALTDMAAEKSS